MAQDFDLRQSPDASWMSAIRQVAAAFGWLLRYDAGLIRRNAHFHSAGKRGERQSGNLGRGSALDSAWLLAQAGTRAKPDGQSRGSPTLHILGKTSSVGDGTAMRITSITNMETGTSCEPRAGWNCG